VPPTGVLRVHRRTRCVEWRSTAACSATARVSTWMAYRRAQRCCRGGRAVSTSAMHDSLRLHSCASAPLARLILHLPRSLRLLICAQWWALKSRLGVRRGPMHTRAEAHATYALVDRLRALLCACEIMHSNFHSSTLSGVCVSIMNACAERAEDVAERTRIRPARARSDAHQRRAGPRQWDMRTNAVKCDAQRDAYSQLSDELARLTAFRITN
jgi:hypothetical protein